MKKFCRAKLSEDSEIIFKSCEEMDYFETEEYCIAECQLRNLGLSHGR